MGELVNFCAGATRDVLPARRVPAMLLSVPEYASTPEQIRTSREMLAAAGTRESILDSGGYQLWLAEKKGICPTHDARRPLSFTDKEANIAPCHVVEAAAALKPTIMMALDYPIRTISGASEQDHEFLGKLGFNLTWARETARLREELCPEVQLFIPVQCYSLAQFDRFRKLLGDTRFEGLSMPIRNLSLPAIAAFLISFHQAGVRRVHILGSTGYGILAIAAYFARHFFDWVSLDATSWRKKAEFCHYLNPLDLSVESLQKSVVVDDRIPMDCPCPRCRGKSYTYIKNLPYREKYDHLSAHNWWVIEQAAGDLYANSSDVIELEAFMRPRCRKPELKAKIVRTLSLSHALIEANVDALEALLCSKSGADPVP
jgi:hypothetical protein